METAPAQTQDQTPQGQSSEESKVQPAQSFEAMLLDHPKDSCHQSPWKPRIVPHVLLKLEQTRPRAQTEANVTPHFLPISAFPWCSHSKTATEGGGWGILRNPNGGALEPRHSGGLSGLGGGGESFCKTLLSHSKKIQASHGHVVRPHAAQLANLAVFFHATQRVPGERELHLNPIGALSPPFHQPVYWGVLNPPPVLIPRERS